MFLAASVVELHLHASTLLAFSHFLRKRGMFGIGADINIVHQLAAVGTLLTLFFHKREETVVESHYLAERTEVSTEILLFSVASH